MGFGIFVIVLVVLSIAAAIGYLIRTPRPNPVALGWVAFYLLALAAVVVYTHGVWSSLR